MRNIPNGYRRPFEDGRKLLDFGDRLRISKDVRRFPYNNVSCGIGKLKENIHPIETKTSITLDHVITEIIIFRSQSLSLHMIPLQLLENKLLHNSIFDSATLTTVLTFNL